MCEKIILKSCDRIEISNVIVYMRGEKKSPLPAGNRCPSTIAELSFLPFDEERLQLVALVLFGAGDREGFAEDDSLGAHPERHLFAAGFHHRFSIDGRT